MAALADQGVRVLRFGPFELNVPAGELRKNGTKLKLESQPLRLLVLLLERRGEVVTREELRAELWPADTFVDFEHSITAAVKRARQVLGDSADTPRYIETLPRRGYRFVAPLEEVARSSPLQPLAQDAAIPFHGSFGIWRSLAVVLFVAVVAAGYLFWRYATQLAERTRRPMLAVLPLDNLTGSDQQEYLSDGLTEEIITELGRLDPARLGVIARTSTLRYRQTKKTIAEIGRELGVDYVMEGSVQQASPHFRITLQLIRVSDQTHLWAEAYDRDLSDIQSVQQDVAERTTRALRIDLPAAAQARLAAGRPVSPAAREVYLRGRYALNRGNGPSILKGREYFEKAIELDPAYAQAYGGLALAYIFLGNYGLLPQTEAKPKAKTFAQKGLALDPSLTDARIALAGILLEYEWDYAGADREFRHAVEQTPNSAAAHQWYSSLLSQLGRHQEAIAEIRTAYELDPASLRVGVDVGRAYYWARRYDRAIDQQRKVLELEPDYSAAHSELGLALLEVRRYDEAITELQKGMALIPGNNGYSIWLGYAYAIAGRRVEAEKMLANQLEHRGQGHVGANGIARTYLGLGDKNQALAWLETACQERDAVTMLNAYPFWDPLRAEPRFQAVLRRVGLLR